MGIEGKIHVFASHKGGTGKTQLCFQAASQYADANPGSKVMLLDMTELGDLTKRCLGGAQGNADVIEKKSGLIFSLLDIVKRAIQEEDHGTIGQVVYLILERYFCLVITKSSVSYSC